MFTEAVEFKLPRLTKKGLPDVRPVNPYAKLEELEDLPCVGEEIKDEFEPEDVLGERGPPED